MNLAVRILGGGAADDVALRDDSGTVLTYAGLEARVGAARGGLAASGVAEGDRVAIILGNRAEFAIAYLALLGIGAVVVPLNPDAPEPERREHLQRSRVQRVIADPADVPAADPVPIRGVDDGVVAVLADTAGTSGASRSAMLTHGNLAAALDQMSSDDRMAIHASDVVYGVLPLFHIFGLNVVLGRGLASGAEIRLCSHFDPRASMDGITVVFAVPPMFDAWVAAGTKLADARVVISGAAPLREATADRFAAATGHRIAQGYGLTEASPTVTSGLLLDEPDPLSVGLPLPGVEVRLVDTDGNDVLQGDPGEIWVRGPNVFIGYDGDPATTGRVLAGGWLHTGDVGVADERGHLSIVDRWKDLIIVSGFNVYPGEVEDVLLAHEGVAQAAVTGAEDPGTGEAVRAVVVPGPGSDLSEAGLIEWCRDHLARYKVPKVVEFASTLPLLPTGKVLRRSL